MSTVTWSGAARTARNKARLSRDRAPVRRNSQPSEAGDDFCQFVPMGERRHTVSVVKTYCEAHRVHGVAPLTPAAVHVLETLFFGGLICPRTGRCEHAYLYIAARARRAYQTTIAAIDQLVAVGLLGRMRRCRPNDGEGPPWVQDTNAYRFRLPEKLQSWWSAHRARRAERARARAPEDAVHAEEARQAENGAAEVAWAQLVSERLKAEWAAERRKPRQIFGPGAAAYLKRLESG